MRGHCGCQLRWIWVESPSPKSIMRIYTVSNQLYSTIWCRLHFNNNVQGVSVPAINSKDSDYRPKTNVI